MKAWIAPRLRRRCRRARRAAPAAAREPAPKGAHDYGFAGLLARDNRADLPPLTLSSGKPVAEGPYTLKSGTYYRIDIVVGRHGRAGAVGRRLLPGDLDQRDRHQRHRDPADGRAFDRVRRRRRPRSMSFIAIVPGTYRLSIPGSHSDTQTATFVIQ